MDEALFRHLWESYQATIDGRQKYGDVELLAQAAERIAWPGAPEFGSTIATVLREKIVEDKSGLNSKHFKLTRDREIIGLAAIHREQGLPANESRRRIAEMFRMEVEAVRKVLERAASDK
jgi:hypothetical protein